MVEKVQILFWLHRRDFCLSELAHIKRYVRVDSKIPMLEDFVVRKRCRSSYTITQHDE